MGMYASLFLFTDDNLRRMVAAPILFDQVSFADEPELLEPKSAPPRSWWSRWFGKAPEPVSMPTPLALGEHEGEFGDLDKAWHGLHFLLTGTAWQGDPPLNLLASAEGGVELTDSQSIDYGAPRVFFSDYARRAHEALAGLSDEELAARYDAAAMTRLEIYPEIWQRPGEGPEYLREYLGTLREFLQKAASHGLGLVVHVS